MIGLLIIVWLLGAPTAIMLFIVLVCRAGAWADRLADRAIERTRIYDEPVRAQVLGGPLDGMEVDLG